jgi:4'-phosphopantetheinyl transferase
MEIRQILLGLLPVSIQARIGEFVRWQDAQRSLLGELMIRQLLSQRIPVPPGQIKIRTGEKGKPYLPGHPVHFNLSHSGEWVVAALAASPVGIDVERIKPNKLRIARRFFTEKEFAAIIAQPEDLQPDYFFELWTLKESYLKATGKGLTQSLGSFSVISDLGRYQLEINGNFVPVEFKTYPIGSGYKLAVCAFEETFSENINYLNINDLNIIIHQHKSIAK